MGNYGSYSFKKKTGIINSGAFYVNPFVMEYDIGKQNRFACDIPKDPFPDTIDSKITDYTLSKMFKDMVLEYNGSWDKDLKNSDGTPAFIPSEGNRLPGGAYKDNLGEIQKVYKNMTCCRKAVGPDAINQNKLGVFIPVLHTAVLENSNKVLNPKDFSQPIYSNIKINTSSTPNITISGVNPESKSFEIDPNYKKKINELTDEQLD